MVLVITNTLAAQISINTNAQAQVMAEHIFGPGITVTNATLHSTMNSSGTFANGNTTNVGFNDGTVLTTGNAQNIPNSGSVFSTQCNSLPNGSDLVADNVTYQTTYDACYLEFDVVSICNTLSTTYVFGSEEYPEYQSYAVDGFGIFISGPNPSGGNYSNVNMAVIPTTNIPISTVTINSGINASYYIDNLLGTGIVYDGITVPMTATVQVVPCKKYHVVVAIADGRDCKYDSGVFLHYQNNNTCPPPQLTVSPDTILCPGDSVLLYATGGADHYAWLPLTGLDEITDSIVIVSPPKTTVYTVLAYMGCDTDHGLTETVTVTILPAPDVFITPVHPIVEMWDSITLTAYGAESYLWVHSGQTTQSIVVTPDETTFYTVIGTSGDSIWPCTAESIVMVEVISGIYVPNAFTPNGDGLNDVFIPESIINEGEIDQYELSIFNRFGERIFVTYGIDMGWNGRYQNRECEQGVYVWNLKVKLKGRYDKTLTGHVTLIR